MAVIVCSSDKYSSFGSLFCATLMSFTSDNHSVLVQYEYLQIESTQAHSHTLFSIQAFTHESTVKWLESLLQLNPCICNEMSLLLSGGSHRRHLSIFHNQLLDSTHFHQIECLLCQVPNQKKIYCCLKPKCMHIIIILIIRS